MTNSLRQRWRTLSPWQRTMLSACVAMLVGWCMLLSPSARQAHRLSSPLPEVAPERAKVRAQPAPSAPAVMKAPSAPSSAAPAPDALGALRAGLASDNAGTRIEALRTAADQNLGEALPELLQRELAADPEVAPTLIQVSAQLAQHAAPAPRSAALTRLTGWLHTESARAAGDDAARGNVSVLVETLSRWNGQEVVPALSETLQDAHIPLHVQTVAVQGLGRLRAGQARAALTAFRARIAQSPPHGGFELELQQEALQAADRALARLPAE